MKLRPWIIVLIIVVILGGWLWTGFNGLVAAREGVDASWAQVQTMYQRRADLIPNVVNTVKGSADFEQSTLTAVTNARSAWAAAQAGSQGQQVAAAQGLDSAISRLLVTVEAYPQLRSTQAFRDLITELEGTENRVATARRDYNETVRGYNVRVKTFPTNLMAGMFGFTPAEMFEATPGAETAPEVDFGSSSAEAASAAPVVSSAAASL
ncbi:MAG: LemA family protein [Candidatus Peribacteraceae bacterium]|jgi:LemA protein